MKNYKYFFAFLVFFAFSVNAHGENIKEKLKKTHYYNKGFYYFEEHKEEKKKQQDSKTLEKITEAKELKEFDTIQKNFDNAVKRFTAAPSFKNAVMLALLIEQQYKRGEQGQKFLEAAYLKYPQLSSAESLASEAIALRKNGETAKQKEIINTISKKGWRLMVFYKKNCKYCELFKKTLFNFKNNFNLHADILGDDSEEAEAYRVTTFPAVLIYNDKKGLIAPVSFGFLAFDEFVGEVYKASKKVYGL